MARKAKGKPLTLFPVRVDEDVKAAMLKLKDEHETINEGLRASLLTNAIQKQITEVARTANWEPPMTLGDGTNIPARPPQASSGKRGIRPKGDSKR